MDNTQRDSPMTTHIDFATLPDAEAARLMAEREGYKFVGGGAWVCPKGHRVGDDTFTYPRSLDAAVWWLGRMGLQLIQLFETSDGKWGCNVGWGNYYRATELCDSPSRAVCNAGWAAVQAREVANG